MLNRLKLNAILLWDGSYEGLWCSLVGMWPAIDGNVRNTKLCHSLGCALNFFLTWNLTESVQWRAFFSVLVSLFVVKSFSCCCFLIALLLCVCLAAVSSLDLHIFDDFLMVLIGCVFDLFLPIRRCAITMILLWTERMAAQGK